MPTAHEAFLPAALELQRSPPSPLGRGVAWAVIALLLTALAWTCWAETDVVIVASGRVIPGGHVKTVQSFVNSTVVGIHVEDGSRVAAGELLVLLDDSEITAQLRQLVVEKRELETERRLQNAVMQALSPGLGHEVEGFAGESEDQPMPRERLQRAVAEVNSGLEEFAAQKVVLDKELATARAEAKKVAETLPLVTRRADALRSLDERGLIATQSWLEVEQERLETLHALAIARTRTARLEASLDAAGRAAARYVAERAAITVQRQAEIDKRHAIVVEQLMQAETRLRHTRVQAPVAGTIQELALHTIGGVVRSGETLMKVVPWRDRLEVEARVQSVDIAEVATGMEAEVKFDALPFTKYGTRSARVASLARDATFMDGLGAVYVARLELADPVDPSGPLASLRPGMGAAVEMKLGERKVIELLLSPILKSLEEAGRER